LYNSTFPIKKKYTKKSRNAGKHFDFENYYSYRPPVYKSKGKKIRLLELNEK